MPEGCIALGDIQVLALQAAVYPGGWGHGHGVGGRCAATVGYIQQPRARHGDLVAAARDTGSVLQRQLEGCLPPDSGWQFVSGACSLVCTRAEAG
jgi:hypothetical protein